MKEQINKGTKEQRNNGTTEQRNKGTKEQNNKGTKKQKVHPIVSDIIRSPGLVSKVNARFIPVTVNADILKVDFFARSKL